MVMLALMREVEGFDRHQSMPARNLEGTTKDVNRDGRFMITILHQASSIGIRLRI